VGWSYENSGSRTHPVAQLAPIRKGDLELYDMSGNVYEWCEGWYREGSLRVLRGGSWNYGASRAEVSNRNNNRPDSRPTHYGFRLARSGGQ